MPGGAYDISFDRGATFSRALRPMTDGEPDPDIATSAFTLVVRDGRRLLLDSYVLEVDEDDKVLMYLTPEQTARYEAHTAYYYVVDMAKPSGEVERILEGKWRARTSQGVLS